MELTVLTYNIHRGIGTDGIQDNARITEVINRIAPDIAALQEVESGDGSTSRLLEYLAARTDMTPISGPTIISASGHYGNAILTKLKPEKIHRHDLSLPYREERGALDVYFKIAGKLLRVITTHLGLKPGERRLQAARILETLHEKEEADYTLLMGDFNEWLLWGHPLRLIHSYFGKSRAIRTFPSRYPVFALDRIWCHPPESMKALLPLKSGLARMASDHLPLYGRLEL